jgi:hypothetical protein
MATPSGRFDMKRVVTILSVLLLLCSVTVLAYAETINPYPPPSGNRAKEIEAGNGNGGPGPSGSEILADLIFVRPFSIAACAVGLVGSLVAIPLTLPTGTTSVVTRQFIDEPVDFTFRRPLGEF